MAQNPEDIDLRAVSEAIAKVIPAGVFVTLRIPKERAPIEDGYCQGCGRVVPGLREPDRYGLCNCDEEEET